MKRNWVLCFALLGAVLVFGAPNYDSRLSKLRSDVKIAMDNATDLTGEQRQILSHARERLRSTASNREIRTAMDNIRFIANGGAFRPHDKQTVLSDIKHLREYRMMDSGPAK
jgi:hydroxypyruvate isomerase